MAKITGKVKSFNKVKGYGFVIGEDNNEYFFHFSSLNMKGFKTVDINDQLSFEPVTTETGKRAVNIDVIK